MFCEMLLKAVLLVLITLSLPSSLEDDKLTTLLASYDGSYEDDQGKEQCLISTVLKVVQLMKEGQKVLIIEMELEEGAKGNRIW